ncbi:hypothetical protein KAFR_0I00610 [Kazachstania africana CBS 2517]|uniref:Translocation protein SEC66 n=1 Tax=Kazachstania africana (strain ATCC 22294 / BCRC 22015 / CBS 2517 / CECT 1963 / NBRC 1671 / NRRL Y-8276) TaxID=1071382 RepID=H2AZP2_KAZAF|nr:hypothetical protein KAFR_0I00610 [Kazachstania africana CBS 2517]CCF59842.1 hypothetical protein KAFR_0I00610 [Kazachstania africana CBS 2517]
MDSDSTFNGTFNGSNNTYSNGTFFEFNEEKVETIPLSFYTPFVYAAIVVISLWIFSMYHKRDQIKKMSELASIFDEHDARDLYFEVKEMADEKKVHEKVIKAALLNRGAEAIRRSFKLKEMAPQIEVLYKNGSVGDEYWQRYQTEIKLNEVEFKETIQEAESLQSGWAQNFVVLCREICFNQALMRRYQSILKRKQVCISEWELNIANDGRLITA